MTLSSRMRAAALQQSRCFYDDFKAFSSSESDVRYPAISLYCQSMGHYPSTSFKVLNDPGSIYAIVIS